METLEATGRIISELSPELRRISDAIHANPELSLQEKSACLRLTDFLKKQGFEVEKGCYGLETAFRAASGTGHPCFAVCSEYDALPGVGHGCGHNLIAVTGLAAFCAIARLLKDSGRPGRVVILGTPGEEGSGGKVRMLQQHCLDEVDAVMMTHPSWRTTQDTGSTAIHRFKVIFHGMASHAAGAPELGINALDAVMLCFAGINAWRQQLPESARVHAIVTEGGKMPNIIPDRAGFNIYLRSSDENWIERMEKRFRDIVRGAELMTGATAEIDNINVPYRGRKPNSAMNSVFFSMAEQLGMKPVIPPHPGRGSSDFGDFSQAKPGIHSYFAISDHEIAGHSYEMAAAAASDFGFDMAMKAATAMASIGLKFIDDAEFRNRVVEEFNRTVPQK